MIVDQAGTPWVFLTGPKPNLVAAFEIESEPVAVPSGGGTVRHAEYHPATESVWFGSDANTLGRLRIARD